MLPQETHLKVALNSVALQLVLDEDFFIHFNTLQ